jgi:hypothetical protein
MSRVQDPPTNLERLWGMCGTPFHGLLRRKNGLAELKHLEIVCLYTPPIYVYYSVANMSR